MNQRKPCKIINDIEFQKKKYHVYIIYIFVEQMTMAQYKTTILCCHYTYTYIVARF